MLTPEIVRLVDSTLEWITTVGFGVTYDCHKCGAVNPVISEVCSKCHIDVCLDGNPLGIDHPVGLYHRADSDPEAREKFIAYVKTWVKTQANVAKER